MRSTLPLPAKPRRRAISSSIITRLSAANPSAMPSGRSRTAAIRPALSFATAISSPNGEIRCERLEVDAEDGHQVDRRIGEELRVLEETQGTEIDGDRCAEDEPALR